MAAGRITFEEAWAAVEAALPAGAYVTSIASFMVDTRTGKPAEWIATAIHETRTWNSSIDARGPTPIAALEALGRRLEPR